MTTQKTVKVPAWTDSQVKALTEGYKGDNSTAGLIALVAGKTAAEVRGKLVSLGIYVKSDAPKTVGGKPAAKKIEIVNAIEILLSMPKNSLESLEKAAKPQLDALAAKLIKMSDKQAAEAPAVAEAGEPITEAVNTNGM